MGRITGHGSLCGQSGAQSWGVVLRRSYLKIASAGCRRGEKMWVRRCTIYRALLLRLRLCDSVTVVVADGLWWGYLR
jgi:hypothetical protein